MNYRADFPIFDHLPHLVYLDSAASGQKPIGVIEAVTNCYKFEYSNIHRGVHRLSQQLTNKYENVREKIANFVNAQSACEIVFTKGTTEALNLLANSLGQMLLKSGDKVLISGLEHHANIVPWQIICQKIGAQLQVLPINLAGELVLDDIDQYLQGVKILSLSHCSNALGTINPIKLLIDKAKSHGVTVIIDGAQAIAHIPVDVKQLDCDFYVFSGHKIYGPTGVGVLYGKKSYLEAMPVYQGGGDMILSVAFDKTIYADIPHKFEAGTPSIASVIGLGEAIEWVKQQGIDNLTKHEQQLHNYFEERLQKIDGLTIIGQAKDKVPVTSFVLDEIHPHDAGTIFDQYQIAVRVGHHCAEPVMRFFQIPATIRASIAPYNNFADLDKCIEAIAEAKKIFCL